MVRLSTYAASGNLAHSLVLDALSFSAQVRAWHDYATVSIRHKIRMAPGWGRCSASVYL